MTRAPRPWLSCITSGAAVVAAMVVATPALAANKSLPVAVARLPGDVEVIASLDGVALRSTKLYSTTVPLLFSMASSAQSGLDEIKKACGFDPLTAIDDVTAAVDGARGGGVFVGLNVGESAFTSCLVSLGKQKSGGDVKTSKSGDIVTVTATAGTFFFAWLPGDVIAFARNPRDQKDLERFIGGAGALASNKQMTTWLGMADPNALAIVASTRGFSSSGLGIDGGVGSLVYKSGTFEAKLTVETGSKSKAEMIEKGAGLLKGMLGSKVPSEVTAILGTLDVKARGTMVVAKASAPEADLASIAGWLMKGMP